MKSCGWCQETLTQEYVIGYCSQACFEAWFNHIEQEVDEELYECANCGGTFVWEDGYNDCCSFECNQLLFIEETEMEDTFTYQGKTLTLEEDIAWEDQYG